MTDDFFEREVQKETIVTTMLVTMSKSWKMNREDIGRLNCVTVSPSAVDEIERIAVYCHGFGAPGDDLVGLAEPIVRAADDAGEKLLLVFPAAPIDLSRYGMPGGRAWWPLNMARLMALAAVDDFSEMRDEVPPGIDEAREMLVETVQTLLDRFSLPYSSLSIGGFSQGAMLTVDTVVRGLPAPPGKLIAMSGALICESLWKAGSNRLENLPILQSHGRMDSILPIQTGRWLHEFFQAAGSKIDYVEFNGDHTIPYEILPKLALID